MAAEQWPSGSRTMARVVAEQRPSGSRTAAGVAAEQRHMVGQMVRQPLAGQMVGSWPPKQIQREKAEAKGEVEENERKEKKME